MLQYLKQTRTLIKFHRLIKNLKRWVKQNFTYSFHSKKIPKNIDIVFGLPVRNVYRLGSIIYWIEKKFSNDVQYVVLIYLDGYTPHQAKLITSSLSLDRVVICGNRYRLGLIEAWNYLVQKAGEIDPKFFKWLSDHDVERWSGLKSAYENARRDRSHLLTSYGFRLNKNYLLYAKGESAEPIMGSLIYGIFDFEFLKAVGGLPRMPLADAVLLRVLIEKGLVRIIDSYPDIFINEENSNKNFENVIKRYFGNNLINSQSDFWTEVDKLIDLNWFHDKVVNAILCSSNLSGKMPISCSGDRDSFFEHFMRKHKRIKRMFS